MMFPDGFSGVSARRLTLPTGVALRVVEAGPSDAPPVILIHGIGASVFSWRHLITDPPAGHRCIAIDLRGHGGSDKPTHAGAYRTEALLEDLDAVWEALRLEQVVLAGHSMGGSVALHFARTRAGCVSRLILANPAGLTRKRLVAAHRFLPRSLVRRLGARLVPRWLVSGILRHAAYGDARLVTEEVVDGYWSPTRDDAFAFAFHALLREFQWRPLDAGEVARIRIPTLVLIGALDRVIHGVRGPARAFPLGRIVEIPDAGHCVVEERPAPVRSAIEEFLGDPRFS